MTKLKSRFKASPFFSWHWNKAEFTEQWKYLDRLLHSGTPQGETIWQTRFKAVQLLNVPDKDGEFRVAYKNYEEKRFLRYLLRPSLAVREAIGFEVTKSLGIPAAEVLAFGEVRRFFNLKSAYFVTRFEENTETLLYFQKRMEERETLLALLKENIKYLAKMHVAGFVHCGAHPRNILWRKKADGSIESIWIDLASLRKTPGGKKYWKYILTDLSDFTEIFQLTQPELDMLAAEYRTINDIPIAYQLRTDHERKFSQAYCVR